MNSAINSIIRHPFNNFNCYFIKETPQKLKSREKFKFLRIYINLIKSTHSMQRKNKKQF